jgi:hypothetical protein
MDYAVGHVEGTINLAQVEFAGYVIPQQAFCGLNIMFMVPQTKNDVLVVQADTRLSRNLPLDGMIGLGPDINSNNFRVLAGPAGSSPLANILKQNASTPNILTLALGRQDGAFTDPMQGTLTIGEIIPGMEAVTNQPKLTVVPESTPRGRLSPHWSILLDKDGVKVNGKTVTLPKSVDNDTTTPDQLLFVLDSGFSLPPVPKYETSCNPRIAFAENTLTEP